MPGHDDRILAFDFFGTLFDISSMVKRIGKVINVAQPAAFLDDWRRKQLEYSYLLTVMGEYESFLSITERALDYAIHLHGIELTGSDREKLMELWVTPELYQDVVPTLRILERRKCAILSNGNADMLSTGLGRSGISDYFDAIISVEEAGVFKPHRDAYSLVASKFDVKPSNVVFLSSNGWDIAGASHFGFYTVWVNRGGLPRETLDSEPVRMIRSLSELPGLLTDTDASH